MESWSITNCYTLPDVVDSYFFFLYRCKQVCFKWNNQIEKGNGQHEITGFRGDL